MSDERTVDLVNALVKLHNESIGRMGRLEARIAVFEQGRDKEAVMANVKSQAAQQQAQGVNSMASQNQGQALYAPLRSDTKPLIDLAAFARRLLNPDDLAHAVTHEVRNAARRALGMPEVREYDL